MKLSDVAVELVLSFFEQENVRSAFLTLTLPTNFNIFFAQYQSKTKVQGTFSPVFQK